MVIRSMERFPEIGIHSLPERHINKPEQIHGTLRSSIHFLKCLSDVLHSERERGDHDIILPVKIGRKIDIFPAFCDCSYIGDTLFFHPLIEDFNHSFTWLNGSNILYSRCEWDCKSTRAGTDIQHM